MKPNLHRWRWGEWRRRTPIEVFRLITRFSSVAAASARSISAPNRFGHMTASLRFVLAGAFAALLLASAPVANAQIGNDQCSGAIALTSGSTFTMNTANATSTGDPTPTCQALFGKGVWFKYTPTGSGPVLISTCGSSFDTVLQVYTGTCASLTAVACDDDNGPACSGTTASLIFQGTAGTTYLILAGGFNSASGTLSITASLANDTCSGAIPLTACAPYTMSTADATSTGDPAPSCQTTFGKGVWFSYAPTTTGPITISTCGSSYDTVLAVYAGSCGNPVPVACDDDNGPACTGLTASVTITGAVGTVYYILAGGFNSASGTLQMEVLNDYPTITCPPSLTFNTDPGKCSKSNVTYSATASEYCTNIPVSFNPPSGSTFPKGTNTVVCTGTDSSGNKAVCSFTVTVSDIQPPSLICPNNMIVSTDPGTCSKSNVTYTAAAIDNCDGNLLPYITPPSGSTFAKGTNTVSVFASDSSGNSTSCTFTVTVIDTQPPQLTCPPNLIFAVDPGTCSKSKVTYSTTATDNCDQSVPVIFSPPTGSTFPRGTNTVVCSATDSSSNKSTCTFTVTVLDNITLMCQTDRIFSATSTAGAVVRYAVVATDPCDPSLTITSIPPSGSVLPYGTTPVTSVAGIASGQNTPCGFNVTVVQPSCCQGKFWTLSDVSNPPGRYGHAMAYDAVRGRVVMFGGNGASSLLGDTWEWNGTSWTLMATTGPSPRAFTAMDYDTKLGKTVLFGGLGAGGAYLGDTWVWDGVSWQPVSGTTGPPVREAHAMAYDLIRHRSVLFGGATTGSILLSDTWEFDGAQWISITPGSAVPAARGAHSMAFGSAQDQLLLFGGLGSNNVYLSDTWKWDGTNWMELATNGPGPRDFSAMAYNENCDSVVLFGGLLYNTNYFSDTWEWNGNIWTLTGTNNPNARAAHAMAHDGANGLTVLFGGTWPQGILGDTRLYGASQTPPQVVSTYIACGAQRIAIAFNVPLDPVSAQNIANYAISCPVGIVRAVLSDDPRIVLLYLGAPLTGGLTGGCCTLTISGVRDICGHLLRQYSAQVCCTPEPCARGSSGFEYWLTFPGNYAPDPSNPPAPQLFIAGTAGVFGTVAMPLLSYSVPFTIPAGGVAVVTLSSNADLGNFNDIIQSNGIHVVASQPVAVYGHNHILYTTDSYLGLSTRTLGQAFLVMAYQNNYVGVPELDGVQFAVAAGEDNTTVTIVPSAGVGVHPPGVPFNLTLNHGQTYQLRDTNDYPADLTGSIVVANNPISVFGSHQCANIPNSNMFFCDYLVEQIPPVEMWGKNFITVPLFTRMNGDTFHIMALLNGTTVSVNGAPLPGTINRGQFYEVQLINAAQITSSGPVMVAQFSDSSDFDSVLNSDPFMVVIPPTPLYATSYIIESPTNDFPINYVNLVAPNAAVGQVKVDGVVAGPFAAVGASGYSGCQFPVNPGPHTIINAGGQPFGVIAYGFNLYDAYGYPGGTCGSVQVTTNRFICPQTNTVIQAGPGCVGVVPDMTGGIGNGSLAITVLQNPPAGTLLGPGSYPVTFTIVDVNGARTTCNSSITVNQPSGPGLICPANIVTNCSSTNGQYVTYAPALCNSNGFTVTVSPPSGSLFPPGVTLVTCSAVNSQGIGQNCQFTVTVNCTVMGISQTPTNLTITWTGGGNLQKAPTVMGPWIPISNAVSPFRISITSTQGFFRVHP